MFFLSSFLIGSSEFCSEQILPQCVINKIGQIEQEAYKYRHFCCILHKGCMKMQTEFYPKDEQMGLTIHANDILLKCLDIKFQ